MIVVFIRTVVEPSVANVVGTIIYQQELALNALGDTLSKRDEIVNVTYDPSKNHWLQTRFAPDETYVAFYRSGKCSITGANSVKHFYEVAERVNKVMRDILNFKYKPKVEIINIVATWDTGCFIPLETLMIELGLTQTEYEPEQFPALIYRGGNYVMLIFASGKLLCTGLSDLDDVTDAIEDVVYRIQTVV